MAPIAEAAEVAATEEAAAVAAPAHESGLEGALGVDGDSRRMGAAAAAGVGARVKMGRAVRTQSVGGAMKDAIRVEDLYRRARYVRSHTRTYSC